MQQLRQLVLVDWCRSRIQRVGR